MTYNITNATQGVGFDIIKNTNQITGGAFGLGILLAIYVIILLSVQQRFGLVNAFGAAGFITTLVGILLILGGVLSGSFVIYLVILIALTVAGVFISSRYP